MLLPAASFTEAVVAVHILAVVIAFGVTFAYPLFAIVGARMDPRATPWFHRMWQLLNRRLINPGLAVVLLAGIYLASDEHQWKHFYVQWGLAAVVILGGLSGGFLSPREGKLAELAQRDVAGTAAGAEVTWSAEYHALLRQVAIASGLMNLIVVLTVFFMALHLGA